MMSSGTFYGALEKSVAMLGVNKGAVRYTGYMRHIFKSLFLLISLAGNFLSAPLLFGSMILQDDTVVKYKQEASDRLSLSLRKLGESTTPDIQSSINGISLPVTIEDKQASFALLILIDTSDPRRNPSIQRQSQDIQTLLGLLNRHFSAGLACFDTELRLLAPPGSSHAKILQEVREIKAEGKTTELYRNALGAMSILRRTTADHKYLLMLSDGLAEDHAYFHRDVVQSALQNEISIYALGYADTVANSVALQTLRRLAEDTGGQYHAAAPAQYTLPPNTLKQIVNNMQQIHRYTIDLAPAIEARLEERHNLQLAMQTSRYQTLLNIPVDLPVNSTEVVTTPPVVVSTPPRVIVERIKETSTTPGYLFWLLLILSVGLFLLIIAVSWRARGQPAQRQNRIVEPENKQPAIAWLEILDDQNNRRFPIYNIKTKIGRYRGNDITLADSAISRYHAEIILDETGHFRINDLSSKNGLSVNDQETRTQILKNHDIIEIGDIRLRFEGRETTDDDMQETQMFRTQLPMH